MSLFNTVWVTCPACGTEVEFQSKGGSCSMESYTLAAAPAPDVAEIAQHVQRCPDCNIFVGLDVRVIAFPKIARG